MSSPGKFSYFTYTAPREHKSTILARAYGRVTSDIWSGTTLCQSGSSASGKSDTSTMHSATKPGALFVPQANATAKPPQYVGQTMRHKAAASSEGDNSRSDQPERNDPHPRNNSFYEPTARDSPFMLQRWENESLGDGPYYAGIGAWSQK